MGSVASKNVDTGKAVTFSGVTLKAATTTYKNYVLKMDTSKTIDITTRQITLDGSEFEVADRVYMMGQRRLQQPRKPAKTA